MADAPVLGNVPAADSYYRLKQNVDALWAHVKKPPVEPTPGNSAVPQGLTGKITVPGGFTFGTGSKTYHTMTFVNGLIIGVS
jgi:hypothetical protein